MSALALTPIILLATANGLPVAHTGAFGEPGCNQAGCHRNEPLPPGSGTVSIDVGPYSPGQKQRLLIVINDTNARRWGFQVAARESRSPARQAGSFSVPPDSFKVRVRCASGGEPPCGSEMEYATHTSLGSLENRFALDWTAPSSDVGAVVFTVAALGADGDGGTNGDRSFTTTATALFAPANQPALSQGGVVSAASFQAPSGAVAHGALVTLFGQKLAPTGFSRTVSRSDLVEGRLPIELNRTGADFILPPGVTVPAYVLFVNETQINVQVPAMPGAFTGRVEVQAVFNRGQGANEVRSNRVPVNVQPLGPALFTFGDGRTAAAVHSAVPSGAPVGRLGQFPDSRPARPGDIILLFGTGFGPTNPAVEPGSLADSAARLVTTVGVRLGGLNLAAGDILYAGAAPSFAGLQQFNIRIPSGLGSGDVPITLNIDGLETQSGVTLRVEP